MQVKKAMNHAANLEQIDCRTLSGITMNKYLLTVLRNLSKLQSLVRWSFTLVGTNGKIINRGQAWSSLSALPPTPIKQRMFL